MINCAFSLVYVVRWYIKEKDEANTVFRSTYLIKFASVIYPDTSKNARRLSAEINASKKVFKQMELYGSRILSNFEFTKNFILKLHE